MPTPLGLPWSLAKKKYKNTSEETALETQPSGTCFPQNSHLNVHIKRHTAFQTDSVSGVVHKAPQKIHNQVCRQGRHHDWRNRIVSAGRTEEREAEYQMSEEFFVLYEFRFYWVSSQKGRSALSYNHLIFYCRRAT